jgi:hypothetical protein
MGKGLLLGTLFGILLLSLNTSQLVFASGQGSPIECENPDFKDDNIADATTSSSFDAGADIITGVCIKAGAFSFGSDNQDQHSDLIEQDGTYGNAKEGMGPIAADVCYTVVGLGTSEVTVTEVVLAGCKGLSHVEYFIDDGVPPDEVIGGQFIPIDTISLLLAGAQSTSWMMPVVLSLVGIGLFLSSKKSKNS